MSHVENKIKLSFYWIQLVSMMEVTEVKQHQNLMLLSCHYNLFIFFMRNVDYSYFSIEHTSSLTQVICTPKSSVCGLYKEKEEGINCLIIMWQM